MDWLWQNHLTKSFGFGLPLKKKSRHSDSSGVGWFAEGGTLKKTRERLRICLHWLPHLNGQHRSLCTTTLTLFLIFSFCYWAQGEALYEMENGKAFSKESKVGTLQVGIKLFLMPLGAWYCNKISVQRVPAVPWYFPMHISLSLYK